jgi:hypothetical protein
MSISAIDFSVQAHQEGSTTLTNYSFIDEFEAGSDKRLYEAETLHNALEIILYLLKRDGRSAFGAPSQNHFNQNFSGSCRLDADPISNNEPDLNKRKIPASHSTHDWYSGINFS